ncbi:hypothetical protein Bca101_057594 [Brassica carinata]
MSGNDYSRYLSAGSRKNSNSKRSSSRHTNPGSSSNSQADESSAVPNSQAQSPPPAPAQAPPPAPAPAPPPAPAPNAAPMPVADLVAINMTLASPGHDLLPHLHPDRPPNMVCTSLGSVPPSFTSSGYEDQSLKKIIKEQAILIKSQGNEIGKLNAVVRYLASKDSTVVNIVKSEDVPSHNSEGMSNGFGDDDEFDAI